VTVFLIQIFLFHHQIDEGYVSGTYVVTYIDASGCLSAEGTGEVTINKLPNPPVVETVCVCEGEDAQFTIVNTEPGAIYSWYDPNGDYFSDNSAPVIAAGTAANGDVYTVVVTDANGCIAEGSGTVCIHPEPTVEAGVMYVLAADCTPSDVSLTATASGGTPDYTYLWSDYG